MIGAATLASGALRIALIEGQRTTAHAFPAAAVLAYGGYFTLLLVAVYAPAYSSLLALGRHLRTRSAERFPRSPRIRARGPSGSPSARPSKASYN
jgi:hypothetical protein